MEDRELLLKSDPEFDRLAFTVLAIEASAQKMGISPSEIYSTYRESGSCSK